MIATVNTFLNDNRKKLITKHYLLYVYFLKIEF